MNEKTKELASILKKNEAALILSDPNRFYLAGFDASDGAVVVTRNTAYLLVDFRYIEAARNAVKDCTVIMLTNLTGQLNDIIKQDGITKLYVENGYVSLSEYSNLKKKVKAEIIIGESLDKKLGNMRAVKSKDELANINAAQKLTDEAFSYICERISAGRTEKEVMLDMEFYIRKAGSEGIAFDFIVVSGKKTSLPHGVPGDKIIEKGDFVTLDFGAVVNGYRSDMTRTVAVGGVTNEQKAVYNTVGKAQKAALAAVKPGIKCADIDKIARDIIYNAGYEGYFGHSLGHSVGIEIHEKPAFSPKSKEITQVGNVITVEPGIYIPDKFGVRTEDMVYITETGCKNLTKSPKKLIVL